MMKQKTTGHRRIPSRLLGVSLLLAGMSLVPVSGPVWAREGATAATFGLVDEAPHTFLRPRQVSLFPTHALVQGEEELEIRVRDGVGRVELFVPENARNLQFDLGDVRLASWRSRVAPAAVADGDARRRQDLLARKRAVEGELEAVSARLGLWTAHAGERSLEALEKLDARMAEVIPRLRERQAALQRELKTISSVLASLPRVTESGQLVILLLDGAKAGKVRVRYAYTLDNSGWDPVYDLDARPEEGTVRVLLTARLRQNSGMDWRGCDLSIVWQDARPLEAPVLPVWRVDEGPVPRPYARAAAEFKSAPVVLAARADSAANAPAAPVPVLDKGTYARWDLGLVTLPQGQERLVLRQEEWKAPLQWVARPDEQGSPVWLMVERALDSTPWPSAQAEFSVDGLPVGSGRFVPEGNKVRLYFGVDPRVSVTTTTDDKRRGETGIIGKRQTWSWNWTYTVHNARAQAVTVRVERPEPLPVNKSVEVSLDGTRAQKGEDHSLFWKVEVPAGESHSISHGVNVSAPAELGLSPVAP